MNWQTAVEKTVTGLGYELVDCERSSQGLLRAYIDRLPLEVYPGGPSEFVTVDDCEVVTRQLQYVLEVEGVEYGRLEVSSPGLDRPLTKPTHFARFAGEQITLTLKVPFQGRKKYDGLLRQGKAQGEWELVFRGDKEDQVLGFKLDEIREARLVPVVDFKGRRAQKPSAQPDEAARQQRPVSAQELGDLEE